MNIDRPSGPDRPSHQEFLRELAALDEAIRRPDRVERARVASRPPDRGREEPHDLILPPPDMIAPRQPDHVVPPRERGRGLLRIGSKLAIALCGGLVIGGGLGMWLSTDTFDDDVATERVARASMTEAPVRSVAPGKARSAVRSTGRSRSASAGAARAGAGASAGAAVAPIAMPRVPAEPGSKGVTSLPTSSPSSSPSAVASAASSPEWIAAAAPTVTTELIAPPPAALASHAGIPPAVSAPVPLIAAPSNVSAAMSVVAADRAAIEAALRRYEQAYERLDAKAASAVWPAVDRRALSRAFAGLASQALDMRACEVTVRAGASTATASCHGSAEYVRKVGDARVHVEPRQWTFTLNKREGEWKIEAVDGSR